MGRVVIERDGLHILECDCGGDCLHQQTVRVYQREEDGDGRGVVVSAMDQTCALSYEPLPARRPTRRHWLEIEFRCENCDQRTVLEVVQNKGRTYLHAETLRAGKPRPAA